MDKGFPQAFKDRHPAHPVTLSPCHPATTL